MKNYIGCSGYNYREWKGKFYPEGLPQSKWLQYYCQHYNTIEINASFYKIPVVKNLQKWYNSTPVNFKFAIKANRLITHYRKFKNVKTEVEQFYETIQKGLGDKLSCVLFQLPPSLKYDPILLENILGNLNDDFTNVLEFRHASWWNEEVYKAFKKRNIVFCGLSIAGLPESIIKTSSIGYIRLHGKEELYKSSYKKEELTTWARNIEKEKFNECYIYFNNTWFMAAIENANELKGHLNKLK